jgi:ubiquitin-like 1-activating enzyme E1 A
MKQALWQYQSLHNDQLPDALENAAELESLANDLIASADVNTQVLTQIPRDLIEYELWWH